MKTKLMKKMIALICAAVMTTSCATVSVGAFKAPEGSSQELVYGVAALNARLSNCEPWLKSAYNKIENFYLRAENTVYVGNDKNKNFERDSISSVGRYIVNRIKNNLTIDSEGKCLKLEELKDSEIYNNDDVTEISSMLDTFEKHVKGLCRKIYGLSADWKKNRLVFYKEKESNIMPLKEGEEDTNGTIKTYSSMYLFIKQDIILLDQDINNIASKVEKIANEKIAREDEKKRLLDSCIEKCKEYNSVCSEFDRLRDVLGIEKSPLSAELQQKLPSYARLKQELIKLTGRNDDDFTIGPDITKKFQENIENLRFANRQIGIVTNMLKEFTKKLITTSEVRNNICSIMNEYVDGITNSENIKKGAEWKSSEAFKKTDERKNIALSVLKLLASTKGFTNEVDEIELICDDLNIAFDHLAKNPSFIHWDHMQKSASILLKNKLNGLLEKFKNINTNV